MNNRRAFSGSLSRCNSKRARSFDSSGCSSNVVISKLCNYCFCSVACKKGRLQVRKLTQCNQPTPNLPHFASPNQTAHNFRSSNQSVLTTRDTTSSRPTLPRRNVLTTFEASAHYHTTQWHTKPDQTEHYLNPRQQTEPKRPNHTESNRALLHVTLLNHSKPNDTETSKPNRATVCQTMPHKTGPQRPYRTGLDPAKTHITIPEQTLPKLNSFTVHNFPRSNYEASERTTFWRTEIAETCALTRIDNYLVQTVYRDN